MRVILYVFSHMLVFMHLGIVLFFVMEIHFVHSDSMVNMSFCTCMLF